MGSIKALTRFCVIILAGALSLLFCAAAYAETKAETHYIIDNKGDIWGYYIESKPDKKTIRKAFFNTKKSIPELVYTETVKLDRKGRKIEEIVDMVEGKRIRTCYAYSNKSADTEELECVVEERSDIPGDTLTESITREFRDGETYTVHKTYEEPFNQTAESLQRGDRYSADTITIYGLGGETMVRYINLSSPERELRVSYSYNNGILTNSDMTEGFKDGRGRLVKSTETKYTVLGYGSDLNTIYDTLYVYDEGRLVEKSTYYRNTGRLTKTEIIYDSGVIEKVYYEDKMEERAYKNGLKTDVQVYDYNSSDSTVGKLNFRIRYNKIYDGTEEIYLSPGNIVYKKNVNDDTGVLRSSALYDDRGETLGVSEYEKDELRNVTIKKVYDSNMNLIRKEVLDWNE